MEDILLEGHLPYFKTSPSWDTGSWGRLVGSLVLLVSLVLSVPFVLLVPLVLKLYQFIGKKRQKSVTY